MFPSRSILRPWLRVAGAKLLGHFRICSWAKVGGPASGPDRCVFLLAPRWTGMVAKRGEAKSRATSASIDGTEFVDVTKGTGRHYSYQTPWQIGLVARSKPYGTVTQSTGGQGCFQSTVRTTVGKSAPCT